MKRHKTLLANLAIKSIVNFEVLLEKETKKPQTSFHLRLFCLRHATLVGFALWGQDNFAVVLA